MSEPDLTNMRALAQKEGAPTFDEPWQAQAFALVVQLHVKGLITWPEWAETLAAQIASNPEQEYYLNWLAALETLVLEKNLTSASALATRKTEWEAAAAATPHGHPISL